MKGAYLPAGSKALEVIDELLDFIAVSGHQQDCVRFGKWSCGQRGLLNKYRPAVMKRKTNKQIHKKRRTRGLKDEIRGNKSKPVR